MPELRDFEALFYSVLEDLREFLDEITLVGGWAAYLYTRYLWQNRKVRPVTTTDIDFGLGSGGPPPIRTIFAALSSRDYTERHPRFGKTSPVVLF